MSSPKKTAPEHGKSNKKDVLNTDIPSNVYKEIEKELQKDTISKETLYQWFKEELQRKDDEIAKLKNANNVLFKTALKANERTIEDKEVTSNKKTESSSNMSDNHE
ncbi:MAG: hypothetical protein ACMXYE_01265 [Candidatus Woesearchaeota archaeon]